MHLDGFLRGKNYVRGHVSIKDQPGVLTKLKVSSESLQALIDNTEGVISFELTPTEHIWIINAASREEL